MNTNLYNRLFSIRMSEKILEAWISAGKSRNIKEMVQFVPDLEDLSHLLEVAFLASIEKEEKCSISFRLVYFPDATTENLQEHAKWIDAFPFHQEIPFTAKNIAKLSPAFDQGSTSLAIAKNQNGSLLIVGALFYGRAISRLETGQGYSGRPRTLILSSRSPGTVAVAFGDGVVGRLDRGVFIPANPGPMASPYFYERIIQVISLHEAYIEHEMLYWYLYRDCLEKLYATVAEEGHGGTIVWCPRDKLTSLYSIVKAGIKTSSRINGHKIAVEILNRQKQCKDSGSVYPILADSLRRLSDYLDMAARLACADGALIIDDEFRIYRFKCHLAAKQWKGKVFEGPLKGSQPKIEIDFSSMGTRHNSAISAVAECDGIIAFVVSEDGPARTIMKIGNSVVVWPDCLNTVFID